MTPGYAKMATSGSLYPGMKFMVGALRSAAVATIGVALFAICGLSSAQRIIDPTFLYRNADTAPEKPSDMTTPACHYHPLFGNGDAQTSVVVGVARYGEAVLDPHGTCRTVSYPEEDQVVVVLQGSGSALYGTDEVPLKTEDYIYFPATVPHQIRNESAQSMRVVVMGFRTKGFEKVQPPPHPLKANIEDVPATFVSGHPESSHFRLLMGDVDSKRDRIAAGRVLTSLFLMEIDPDGTNFPHHHEREEEIYLVLSGHGTMVAGGGMDGIAGQHPAKAGDAYFFRLNATVGYYSAPGVKSRILCVRSWYPGMVLKGMEH